MDAPHAESETGLAPAAGKYAADGGRFLPGAVIAGRYRMVALLGKGGMGEVYRADDLKLGQSVALKFLPTEVERNPDRLQRFMDEVRVSLRVTHPSVCRVFDVGQVDRRHFLSMEFVDGEDLGSLLRRIGRLPEDKAVDIARQLCAGLMAAHDQGVLHRDIKPANIMIDGRGRAKITDFGLAGAFVGVAGAEARAGTPKYQAPEQLEGKALSERTDLYALGLVLYELFTGKSAFDARDDDARRGRSSTPTSPSSHVSGLDPLVERAILRCLETDPAKRPASAASLAASLPGGDPLAMAIAAGETPSPALVAAAGAEIGLQSKTVWLLCAVGLVGIVTLALLTGQVAITTVGAPLKPLDVMIERAREILSAAGIPGPVEDSASGLMADLTYLNYATEHRLSSDEDGPAEHGIWFWYRQAPAYLERNTLFGPYFMTVVQPWDPPLWYSGEASVVLNRRGQLRDLVYMPPQQPEPGSTRDADWSALFKAAGLDETAWITAEPRWTPQYFADRRLAWAPRSPQPNRPQRVEAASFRGVPVSFTVVYPWTRPLRDTLTVRTPGQRLGSLIGILVSGAILIGSAWLARRNVRLDRADRKGAVRLGLTAATLIWLGWLITEHHVPTIWEMELALMGVAMALVLGLMTATFYLALEPEVRRRWPGILVSWSRLVAGDVWNPLVARDVLIGCVVVTVIGSIDKSGALLGWHLTGVLPWIDSSPEGLMGLRQLVSSVAGLFGAAVSIGLFQLFLFFVVRLAVRREWATVLVCSVIVGVPAALTFSTATPVQLPVTILVQALLFLMLARVGLVASITALFVTSAVAVFPVTWPPTAWHSPIGFVGLALLAGLVIVASRIVARAQERAARRTSVAVT